jgi:hypothetical protein
MSKGIDEQFIRTRMMMEQCRALVQETKLPDGIYMHNFPARVERRIEQVLSEAWLELADTMDILKKLNENKADA